MPVKELYPDDRATDYKEGVIKESLHSFDAAAKNVALRK
jgi:hypothetical protein